MGCNYCSILKPQRCSRWSLEMGKYFHRTLHWAYDYLSMLGLLRLRLRLRHCLFNQNRYRYHIRFTKTYQLQFIHVSKRGTRLQTSSKFQSIVKMCFKTPSANVQLFCFSLNVLTAQRRLVVERTITEHTPFNVHHLQTTISFRTKREFYHLSTCCFPDKPLRSVTDM